MLQLTARVEPVGRVQLTLHAPQVPLVDIIIPDGKLRKIRPHPTVHVFLFSCLLFLELDGTRPVKALLGHRLCLVLKLGGLVVHIQLAGDHTVVHLAALVGALAVVALKLHIGSDGVQARAGMLGHLLAQGAGQVWQASPTAGLYAITADADFEAHFGKKAAKRRKIYNGMIPCQIYMYFDRPVKPVRK